MTSKDGLHLVSKIGHMKKYYLILKKLKHGLKVKMNIGEVAVYCLLINPRIKIIEGTQLAQEVKKRLDDDLGIENEIKCTPEIRVAHPGELFDCEIIDPNGRAHHLQAKIIDLHGSFEIIS